jgi:cold shock protein
MNDLPQSRRYIGAVKWYNANKGYGFFRPDDGSLDDVFVHTTALQAAGINSYTIRSGDSVAFNIRSRDGRACAADIKLLAMADAK